MSVINFDNAGGITIEPNGYDAFINGNNAAFGTVPSISSTNRELLQSILDDGNAVEFGAGIYPFDGEIVLGGKFDLRGAGRGETLLWAPQSHFMHYTTGGATYPRLKELTIEASGNVLRANGWSVNAIHGLLAEDCAFVSYHDHAFETDKSTAGGTGCPIYGSKFSNVGVYAGPGKAAFYEWQSGSNVFDNVVDQHYYFRQKTINKKGAMKALFWNCTVHRLCNSNISYSGMDYVYLFDKPGVMAWFGADNNLFEGNSFAFQSIVKAGTSNLFINTSNNRYLHNVAKENGHAYILFGGNIFIKECDSPAPLYDDGLTIRNQSNATIRAVSGLVDAGKTKRRLLVYEPMTWFDHTDRAHGTLTPVTEALADENHMSAMWDKYSSELSYFQVVKWPD